MLEQGIDRAGTDAGCAELGRAPEDVGLAAGGSERHAGSSVIDRDNRVALS